MRVNTLAIGILLLTLTAMLPAVAEVSDDQIFDLLDHRIENQILDRMPWDSAHNGGYLLQFSADIFGDEDKEDFLTHSMSLEGTRGFWTIFSSGSVRHIELESTAFHVIREGNIVKIPYSAPISLREALVVDQTLSENGVESNWKHVETREYETLLEQWKKAGQLIRPKIKIILLADFLRGNREWKAIDLTDRDTVGFPLGSGIGRYGCIMLKSDEERLSKMDFTPEVALKLLQQSRIRASAIAEAKPDAIDKTEEPSVIDTQEVATPPPPVQSMGEEPPVSSNRSKVWLWLVGAIVLVLAFAVRLLVKRRLRDR